MHFWIKQMLPSNFPQNFPKIICQFQMQNRTELPPPDFFTHYWGKLFIFHFTISTKSFSAACSKIADLSEIAAIGADGRCGGGGNGEGWALTAPRFGLQRSSCNSAPTLRQHILGSPQKIVQRVGKWLYQASFSKRRNGRLKCAPMQAPIQLWFDCYNPAQSCQAVVMPMGWWSQCTNPLVHPAHRSVEHGRFLYQTSSFVPFWQKAIFLGFFTCLGQTARAPAEGHEG